MTRLYHGSEVLGRHYLASSDYVDSDGRPLAESRAPQACRDGLETELRSCPYVGSRHHHAKPMNVSALKQVHRDWARVLGGCASVLALWKATHGRRPATDVELLEVCATILSLPSYLKRRGEQALVGPVPAVVAGMYKVAFGLCGAAFGHALTSRLKLRRSLPLDPARFLDFVEREGGFIGPTEVCAGPPKLVEEAVSTVLGLADVGRDREVEDLVGSARNFLEYGRCCLDIELTKHLFAVQQEVAARELTASLLRASSRAAVAALAQELGAPRGGLNSVLASSPWFVRHRALQAIASLRRRHVRRYAPFRTAGAWRAHLWPWGDLSAQRERLGAAGAAVAARGLFQTVQRERQYWPVLRRLQSEAEAALAIVPRPAVTDLAGAVDLPLRRLLAAALEMDIPITLDGPDLVRRMAYPRARAANEATTR